MRLASFLRSLMMTMVYPIFLVFISAVAAVLNIIFNSRKIDDQIVKFWGQTSCAMFGIGVKVGGLENMPEGGAILLFNHTSFFDIFSMSAAFPQIRFGAKIELFSIPVFGFAMRRFGALPIARDRRHEVIKVYEQSTGRLQAGEKFALAPEGTRQNQEKLGPFKSGPFIFAINAQVPLVPIVIKNALPVLPKGQYLPNYKKWTTTIDIQVLPSVETKGFSVDQRDILQKQVREKMEPFFR